MAAPDLSKLEPTEVRCPGGLLGIAQDGLLEIKCRHWRCTRGGMVVFHTVDAHTGEIVKTDSYKEPSKEKN